MEPHAFGRRRAPRGLTAIPGYYLDTSAQIARCAGSTSTRTRLKTILQGAGHATSTQVLREWNRICLGTCATLLNEIRTAKDWAEVVHRMAKGYGRAPSRNWLITNLISKPDTTDLEVVEMRAEDFRRVRAGVLFKVGVDTIRDGTQCEVARRRPEHRGGTWNYRATCKKEENICIQPGFLADRMDRALAASRALETSGRDADKKMGKKARLTLEDQREDSTKGAACHAANGIGGDICIALECASDETLITTDQSFDLICPALGVRHERFDP
jgi:hypothetical protein